MKTEVTLTERNKPAVWKHSEQGKADRYYLAYENYFWTFPIKGRKDFSYQHAVAIEIFPHTELPKGLPNYFLVHQSLSIRPLIHFTEGTLERLPVEQFGMSRHCATCAMLEAEYFTEFPELSGGKKGAWTETVKWTVSAKKTHDSLVSSSKTKNRSHLWKTLAWLNWDYWNRHELPYKERTAIIRSLGFSLGDTAIKSAAQEKALTIPQYRRH